MPDRRRHRGRHPQDEQLFAPGAIRTMRDALGDLCWLLTRGYTEAAALKLVGDRFSLRKRQRQALLRCACTDEQLSRRERSRQTDCSGERVAVDGFNCIIIFESMLSGGPVFVGRDGARRDIASVHGSYRRVEETRAAIDAMVELLESAATVHVFFDQPVSNSGRAAEWVRSRARERNLDWQVDVVPSPDRALIDATGWLVATSDGWILDHVPRWIDLAAAFAPPRLWLLDLRRPS